MDYPVILSSIFYVLMFSLSYLCKDEHVIVCLKSFSFVFFIMTVFEESFLLGSIIICDIILYFVYSYKFSRKREYYIESSKITNVIIEMKINDEYHLAFSNTLIMNFRKCKKSISNDPSYEKTVPEKVKRQLKHDYSIIEYKIITSKVILRTDLKYFDKLQNNIINVFYFDVCKNHHMRELTWQD